MSEGRRADSARRRERVLKALDAAVRTGGEITVSGLARTARVDRTFFYRHRDLLERVHAAATATAPAGTVAMTAVSRASLQTDLANALERNSRLAAGIRQLEKGLSKHALSPVRRPRRAPAYPPRRGGGQVRGGVHGRPPAAGTGRTRAGPAGGVRRCTDRAHRRRRGPGRRAGTPGTPRTPPRLRHRQGLPPPRLDSPARSGS
ncbi:DUF6262 family protein [Streptomyces mirabilis]|uniref:DUF6262 family protein n=1 Tax=Streptomyces mirabilis TaxID=68239 RepID=UPI00367827A8